MTDFENQLRRLGDAAEAQVSAVSADQAMGPYTELTAPQINVVKRFPGRRMPMAAAAALMLLVGVVAATFMLRPSDTADMATQTAQATQEASAQQASNSDAATSNVEVCEAAGFRQGSPREMRAGTYRVTLGTSTEAQRFGIEVWDSDMSTDERQAVQEALAAALSDARSDEAREALARALRDEQAGQPFPICEELGDRSPGSLETTQDVPACSGCRDTSLIVFMEPDVVEAAIAAVRARVERLVARNDNALTWTYVDQQSAYDEFHEIFGDDDTVISVVDVADMPSSFRVELDDPLTEPEIAELRSAPGVLKVISRNAPDMPARLRVEAAGIDTPVSVDQQLSDGFAFQSSDLRGRRVIVGRRTGPNGPLRDLAKIKLGDVVEVETVLDSQSGTVAVTRYEVTNLDADTQQSPVLSDDRVDLLIVSEDPNDADNQIGISATLIELDAEDYGLDGFDDLDD